MGGDDKNGTEEAAGLVARALRDLRYGSVEVVVHDGRVVQVERREKLRPSAIRRGGKGDVA